MVCCATSATGKISVEPGTLAHQVLCPSMCGISAGMFSRPSASLTMRARCASTQAPRSVPSCDGSGVMSRVGRK